MFHGAVSQATHEKEDDTNCWELRFDYVGRFMNFMSSKYSSCVLWDLLLDCPTAAFAIGDV